MGDLRKEELVKDMTPKLIGETYMKYPTENSRQKYSYGLYECQYCGKEWETMVQNVKEGHTKSCGCLSGEKHGLRQNKFYKTWYNMVHRCVSPKNKEYKHYGARGITVCKEWLDIKNFVAWCDLTHPNIEGISLDRIDVNGNYEPNNCRWADRTTQNTNQRMKKNNTSGFVGVSWVEARLKWVSRITTEKKRIWLGDYKTIEEAVLARDNYIIENKLPHKLSTDYKGTNE